MVRAKIFATVLAACLVNRVNAGACKPRSSLVTESQSTLSTISSATLSIVTETSIIAETYTSSETSILVVTTTSQFPELSSTTSDSTTTTSAAPVAPVCGQYGTCSPSSDGCRSRIAGSSPLYLGECQDLCRADANCKSIIYNTRQGDCFLISNVAQDAGFYQDSSTESVWYDNSCEIEKREPDPICGAYGDCNESKCYPIPQQGSFTAMGCQQACSADENCGSFAFFPTFNGCYFLSKSLFKSGFYTKETSLGWWFDRVCVIQEVD
ncbi:hypothetical protein ACHAPM_010824 [Fusarium culmorum]|uniref:Apple domain-containing protein n=1 Tax=Fusarium culmorum TaxID=5516 RepID=A0A2T4GL46_FUSCU|nr:hypothetical protein FCULG_00000056 [Fusarium culmorum]